MYASVSCIRIVMIRDGLVFAADKSQGVDAPVASAFGPEQMTLTNSLPLPANMSQKLRACPPFHLLRYYLNTITTTSHVAVTVR